MKRVTLPELGSGERLWIWLSFQRYALMLAALALAPASVVWWVARESWWAWSLALVLGVWIASFSARIWRRWPAKVHALRAALYRIRAGRFTHERVRHHCSDPCFRVVAREILGRAGLPAGARRRLVRAYARELRAESSELVVIDHVRGEVRRVSGGRTSVIQFPANSPEPEVLSR